MRPSKVGSWAAMKIRCKTRFPGSSAGCALPAKTSERDAPIAQQPPQPLGIARQPVGTLGRRNGGRIGVNTLGTGATDQPASPGLSSNPPTVSRLLADVVEQRYRRPSCGPQPVVVERADRVAGGLRARSQSGQGSASSRDRPRHQVPVYAVGHVTNGDRPPAGCSTPIARCVRTLPDVAPIRRSRDPRDAATGPSSRNADHSIRGCRAP